MFSYASVERPVADYLQEKIWEPMGAEADATWLIDRSGQEATYCCLNAVLRDYARLGLLLAHDGNCGGRQIVPAAWIEDATRVRSDQGHLRPGIATRFYGYGYQVWIFPGERRMFAFLGVRGQPAGHGPHRRPQAGGRSGRRGGGRPLAGPRARARRLTADTPTGWRQRLWCPSMCIDDPVAGDVAASSEVRKNSPRARLAQKRLYRDVVSMVF